MRRKLCELALAMGAALTPAWGLAGEQEDKQFAQQIAVVLRDSGRMQHYSIGVKAKDGAVWLAGKVDNDEQLATALKLVSDVPGVKQIVNNVTPLTAPQTSASSKLRQPNSARGLASAVRNATTKSAVSQGGPQQTEIKPARTNPAQYNQNSAGAAPGSRTSYAQAPSMQAAMPQMAPQAMPAQAPQGGYARLAQAQPMPMAPMGSGRPIPAYMPNAGGGIAPAAYDQPYMPNHAWPSYAAYPNYAAVTYPKQYSATAWPFIGPFYPYPQVPLGWRKVSLEWDDGWWFLDFDDRGCQ